MKKIIAILIVLIISASTLAEGILPGLSRIRDDLTPSVHAALDREPISETKMKDGSICVIFDDVSEEEYTIISNYFAKFGCTYDGYIVNGTTVNLDIKNRSKSFSFSYDYKARKVVVIYPADTIEEKTDLSPALSVGDTVTFGTYPQTEKGDDRTPIEWIILDVNSDKVLLISKYALDCAKYNEADLPITWGKSSIRKWLNNDFLKIALTETQINDVEMSLVTVDDNILYNVDGGANTNDKVFLLSIDEADSYFHEDSFRKCLPTDYAIANDISTNASSYCKWWLRSPGQSVSFAATVSASGEASSFGDRVIKANIGVRPCMWVSVKALKEKVKHIDNDSMSVSENKDSMIVEKSTETSSIHPVEYSFTFSCPDIMATGSNEKTTLKVTPTSVGKVDVIYSSSMPSVATIDNNGKIKSLNVGTTMITCEAADGSGVKASCMLRVVNTGSMYNYTSASMDTLKKQYQIIKGGVSVDTLFGTAVLDESLLAMLKFFESNSVGSIGSVTMPESVISGKKAAKCYCAGTETHLVYVYPHDTDCGVIEYFYLGGKVYLAATKYNGRYSDSTEMLEGFINSLCPNGSAIVRTVSWDNVLNAIDASTNAANTAFKK